MKIKNAIKTTLIKLCRRLGETSPLLIDWKDLKDQAHAARLLETMRASKFLSPQEITPPQNKRILVLAPHTDDEVIGMGGTLIKMLESGCTVQVLYFTQATHKELRQESEELAKHLGFNASYLGYEKHQIPINEQSLSDLEIEINSFNPDSLFLPFVLDDHDDHRRISELLFTAFHKNFVKSKHRFDIWAYQVYTPIPLNALIDITDSIEQKCDAIRYYQSQFKSRDWAHYAKGMNAFNTRFLAGKNGENYAEIFFHSNLKNYIKLCDLYFGATPEECYEFQNYTNR